MRSSKFLASKPELVTSFELLNPQMMQWIEQAPFESNIEVIDNSIYFFSDVGGINLIITRLCYPYCRRRIES